MMLYANLESQFYRFESSDERANHFIQSLCIIIKEMMEGIRNEERPFKDILAKLTQDLLTLNQSTTSSDLHIKDAVFAELNKLQQSNQDRIFLAHKLCKILLFSNLYGMDKLRFLEEGGSINALKLREVCFPEAAIPQSYLCGITLRIMSAPVLQKGIGLVDNAAVAIFKAKNPQVAHQDMVTREPQSTLAKMDDEMYDKIELFVKKIQLVYYLFQRNEEYKTLYTELMPQLHNESLSYAEFKSDLENRLSSRKNTSLQLFSSSPDIPLPSMQMCEFFVQYKLFNLSPSKQDYEVLLRRIAASGNVCDLENLLTDPVLDVVNIDIDAKSSNNLDALGWIDHKMSSQRNLDQDKVNGYLTCKFLITEYKNIHNITVSAAKK